MADGLSPVLQSRRSKTTAIRIAIGSTNTFMATPEPASEHRIKPAGPASLQNSSSNKASTIRLRSRISSRISEIDWRETEDLSDFWKCFNCSLTPFGLPVQVVQRPLAPLCEPRKLSGLTQTPYNFHFVGSVPTRTALGTSASTTNRKRV